jgi:hypothetical protein
LVIAANVLPAGAVIEVAVRAQFPVTDRGVQRELVAQVARNPYYSSNMKRKMAYMYFAFFVLPCLFGTQIRAQDKTARDRLFAAHAQYYTPSASGLKSFRCEATIDWKAMLTRFSGTEIPEDNPMLKYLQTVHLSVVDQLKGKGSLEWSDTGVPPNGKEAAAKQMRDGLQTMVGGFFQSWNGYMNGSMVPLPDDSVEVTTAGAGIHLHAAPGNVNFDEDFDKDMLLTQAVVDSPQMKVVAIPTYLRTEDGLVVSAVSSRVNQPPSAAPMDVTFRVEYAKVGSFHVPSHVVYDIKNVGVIEIAFNACQVSAGDSPLKPSPDPQ